MLLEFSCENFRSFKDEATLTMLPVNPYKEHPENIVSVKPAGTNAKGVLLSAAIYGANASGKTNFLRAVDYSRALILGQVKPGEKGSRWPFARMQNEPSVFRYSFISNGVRYNYRLEIDSSGVIAEELRSQPKSERLVFERRAIGNGGYSIKQGSKYPGIKTKLKDYTDNGPVLGLLSKFGIPDCEIAFDWFANKLRVVNHQALIDYARMLEKLKDLGEDNFKKVMNSIRSADFGITGAQLVERDLTEREQELQKEASDKIKAVFEILTGQTADDIRPADKQITFQFRHSIGDTEIGFGFDDESLGTLTMLELAVDFFDAMSKGEVLLIDEIERSLHPILLKSLIALFSNQQLNDKHSQLIFTTHDLSVMADGDMRRDQIWFVEKSPVSGGSELYPLSEFSPRKDDRIVNRYLHGAYGAVPFIEGVL